MSLRTKGEALFEEYLVSRGLQFDFEPVIPGKRKRPDYFVKLEDLTVVFEVKDFQESNEILLGVGAFDPYPKIRERIDRAKKKFREYKAFPCALVLFNPGATLALVDRPHVMLGSMYGDAGFKLPFNPSTGTFGEPQPAFLGRGKVLRPGLIGPENTTLSALITLTEFRPHYELLVEKIRNRVELPISQLEDLVRSEVDGYDPALAVPRLTVWENAFARIRFPREFANGLYDVIWGAEADCQKQVYRGTRLPSHIDPA